MRDIILLVCVAAGVTLIAHYYFHFDLFEEQGAKSCPLVIDAKTGKTTNRNCETSSRSRAP
jgi:hypothetical protein